MKNCEVTISQSFNGSTKAVRYQFDDYRIAQALANILDNVGEPHMESETDFFEWFPIHKESIDAEEATKEIYADTDSAAN